MPREKKPRLKRRKDGRYKCKFRGVQFYGNTPEEAFDLREAYKESVNKGFSSRTTVIDYSLPWLKRTFPTVANSTYAGLAIHLQHLIDSIGEKRIGEVVPSDIKSVYSEHYAGLSASYAKSARQLYCSLFDSAVADGLCRSNPAREKTAKPHKGNKPKERVLAPQERRWIETLCTNHRAFPAVMAMLYAGLRPQEVKALNIDRDVDFINNTITVRMTAHTDAQNAQKYAFSGDGKTELANRSIPLFPPLKQALLCKHGLLITSANGEPVTKTTWRVAWRSYITEMETAINGIQRRWYGRTKEQKRLAAEGKLPEWIDFDIVPYTLRHAFCANICRDAGVDLNTCRRWMGHADAQMILKVYDSVSEDRADAERKKVENWLIGVQNGVQPEITNRRKVEE
jgi:integrase